MYYNKRINLKYQGQGKAHLIYTVHHSQIISRLSVGFGLVQTQ